MLNRIMLIFIAIAISLLVLPYIALADKVTACTISARKDVQVEIHDFSRDRKGPTIWSGSISRGGRITVPARGGEILIEWKDLTQDNPRSQNRNEFCDGNTILVP